MDKKVSYHLLLRKPEYIRVNDLPAVLVPFWAGRAFRIAGKVLLDRPGHNNGHETDEKEGQDHRVDDGEPVDLQSDGEEPALLKTIQPVFVLDVGSAPAHAVRLRDAGNGDPCILRGRELEGLAHGDVGADDLAIVVLESEVMVGPQHELVGVREQVALLQQTHKVPQRQLIHHKFEVVLVFDSFPKMLHIICTWPQGAEIGLVQVLSELEVVQRLGHPVSIHHFAQAQAPVLYLFDTSFNFGLRLKYLKQRIRGKNLLWAA